MTIVYEDPTLPPLLAAPQTFVADPVYADTVEAAWSATPVASPTHGPNRYTLHVPAESTVLSLGEASPRWNTDAGITGYTDNHINFETKSGPQTVVSLGGPATKASIKGYGDAAPVSTHGYSMVTAANAWHDAQKQHYLLSRTHDITLRTKGEGKRAVLQAEHGIVDLNGGKEVNIAGAGVAIGASPGLPYENVKYAEPWHGDAPHSLAAKCASIFNGITNGVVTAHNLAMGATKLYKEYKHGHLHASVDTFADVVEWLTDVGEFIRTSMEVKELFAEEEAVEGSIKMDAAEDVSIGASGNASFFGIHGATLGSTLWTSVSAVVSAGIKGSLFAGVAGAYTSLKGYKKVELGCDHGKAIFDAKKSVQMSAESSVIAVGKELVQVSAEKNAYFAGGDVAWIGTTAGSAWGMHMASSGIKIGKATSADKMMSAAIAADRSITIDKKGFLFKSASSEMTIEKKAIKVTSGSVKLHAKSDDVRVGGKKVLLDGP
ncbi:Hypothetical protein A7982_02577 [Minicystis rosea]|nr:Hypothetical protein A7982_02577 [Minicystis rosea]